MYIDKYTLEEKIKTFLHILDYALPLIRYRVESYADRQIYLLLYSANLTHYDPIYSVTANKKK